MTQVSEEDRQNSPYAVKVFAAIPCYQQDFDKCKQADGFFENFNFTENDGFFDDFFGQSDGQTEPSPDTSQRVSLFKSISSFFILKS